MITSTIILTYALIGAATAILPVPNGKRLLREYDFIIVGSGSAGCALANRLSEVPKWKVLLLEAGRRGGLFTDIPGAAQALLLTDFNWKNKMEYTPKACLGSEGQRCSWPRGKGLGGSTLINHMIYARGNRDDYDRWAAAGNPGWSYDEVLPYFKKSETSTVKLEEPEYHNHSGPWWTEDVTYRPAILESFISAGRELGYPILDYNGRNEIGFSYVQANTKKGVRSSGYSAFIRPVENRPNLHIITRATVTKILINSKKTAHGVIFVKDQQQHEVFATKEVILSGGTFNSPQMLMLSGVGPKAHLNSLGIKVVQDVPGVGRNLKDHLTFTGLIFTVNPSTTAVTNPLEDIQSVLQWLLTRTGPLADNGIGALAFMNTNMTLDNPTVPDMEILFTSGKMTQIVLMGFEKTSGLNNETYDVVRKEISGKDFCLINPVLMHPQSVGYLELQSKNPFIPPRFFGNYLSDPGNMDVKTMTRAIKIILKVADTSGFKRHGIQRHDIVLPACKGLTVDSDEYWECNIRHLAISAYHQIGTCKMGPESDEMAVVDHLGQVRGIKNLRVADCSIIPFPLAGHTSASAFMIGEKISDEIKLRWGSR